MKNKLLSKEIVNPILKRSAVLLIFTVSLFIFQGQYKGHVFNDGDPTIKQPTLESFLSYKNNNNNHAPSQLQ